MVVIVHRWSLSLTLIYRGRRMKALILTIVSWDVGVGARPFICVLPTPCVGVLER